MSSVYVLTNSSCTAFSGPFPFCFGRVGSSTLDRQSVLGPFRHQWRGRSNKSKKTTHAFRIHNLRLEHALHQISEAVRIRRVRSVELDATSIASRHAPAVPDSGVSDSALVQKRPDELVDEVGAAEIIIQRKRPEGDLHEIVGRVGVSRVCACGIVRKQQDGFLRSLNKPPHGHMWI